MSSQCDSGVEADISSPGLGPLFGRQTTSEATAREGAGPCTVICHVCLPFTGFVVISLSLSRHVSGGVVMPTVNSFKIVFFFLFFFVLFISLLNQK